MMIKITTILLCAAPALVFAQTTTRTGDAALARAALAPLTRLVGQWEGDARVSLIPGAPPQTARQRYDITTESGGTVVRVKGVGRAADATQANSVFEADATIWFDPAQNRLRMMARQVRGDSVEAELQVRRDTLVWAIPLQGYRVRFTIAFTDTDWHEVGHMIREGMPPIPMLESRLKKVAK